MFFYLGAVAEALLLPASNFQCGGALQRPCRDNLLSRAGDYRGDTRRAGHPLTMWGRFALVVGFIIAFCSAPSQQQQQQLLPHSLSTRPR